MSTKDKETTIKTSAGKAFGHVPGHTYKDATLNATETARGAMATIAIVWGSAQGRDEEHGRREYTRRGASLEAAIEAARDAASEGEREQYASAEVLGYIETACSRALAEINGAA